MSNDNPNNNYDGYQMDAAQGFESNTENRHRKRRATQPCNSKIVDFGSYGYPTAMNYYFRDQNGKLYTTGYQPNNQTYMFSLMPYRYQSATGSSWGSNNYRAHMASSPGD